MTELPLWVVERGGARAWVFGGGPGLAAPWRSERIEALVSSSAVYWNEVPAIGAEAASLAARYGVDPAAPLATWVSASDLERVNAAADASGVNPQALAPLRPWLAAQIIKAAAETQAGLRAEYSAEAHLAEVATAHGVPVRSEFGTPEGVFESFSSWPRQVEIERLLSTVEEVERGPDWLRRHAEAWLSGDMEHVEAVDEHMKRGYPALYGHLIVRRNEAWVPRIASALDAGEAAFFLTGTGHLVGARGVPVLLERAGVAVLPM